MKSSQTISGRPPDPQFHISGALGTHVWGPDRIRLLDLTSGWNVVNAGWNDPVILAAFEEAAHRLPFRPAWCEEDALLELEAKIAELAPGYVCLPSCSGAEAIDNALKAARMITGRAGVVSFSGAYHGNATGAAVAAGFDIAHLEPFGLRSTRTWITLPRDADDLQSLRALFSENEDIGALVVETVATNAGCVLLRDEILQELAEVCAEHDILLVCDEIGTGMHRTGSLFSAFHRGVRPDILVVGKALTNGLYPLSLCLVSTTIARMLDNEAFASTFGGAPLGCAAALATLKRHENLELGVRAERTGAWLKHALEDALCASSLVEAVHGRGLELAVHVRWDEAAAGLTPRSFLAELRRRSVFATVSASDCQVMIMPPLIAEPQELEPAIEAVAALLCAR